MDNGINFSQTGKLPAPESVSDTAMELLEKLYDGAEFLIFYHYGAVTKFLDGEGMPINLWNAYEKELCHYGYVEWQDNFPGLDRPVTQRLGRVRQSPLLHYEKPYHSDDYVKEIVTLNDEGRAFVEKHRASSSPK